MFFFHCDQCAIYFQFRNTITGNKESTNNYETENNVFQDDVSNTCILNILG